MAFVNIFANTAACKHIVNDCFVIIADILRRTKGCCTLFEQERRIRHNPYNRAVTFKTFSYIRNRYACGNWYYGFGCCNAVFEGLKNFGIILRLDCKNNNWAVLCYFIGRCHYICTHIFHSGTLFFAYIKNIDKISLAVVLCHKTFYNGCCHITCAYETYFFHFKTFFAKINIRYRNSGLSNMRNGSCDNCADRHGHNRRRGRFPPRQLFCTKVPNSKNLPHGGTAKVHQ